MRFVDNRWKPHLPLICCIEGYSGIFWKTSTKVRSHPVIMPFFLLIMSLHSIGSCLFPVSNCVSWPVGWYSSFCTVEVIKYWPLPLIIQLQRAFHFCFSYPLKSPMGDQITLLWWYIRLEVSSEHQAKVRIVRDHAGTGSSCCKPILTEGHHLIYIVSHPGSRRLRVDSIPFDV